MWILINQRAVWWCDALQLPSEKILQNPPIQLISTFLHLFIGVSLCIFCEVTYNYWVETSHTLYQNMLLWYYLCVSIGILNALSNSKFLQILFDQDKQWQVDSNTTTAARDGSGRWSFVKTLTWYMAQVLVDNYSNLTATECLVMKAYWKHLTLEKFTGNCSVCSLTFVFLKQSLLSILAVILLVAFIMTYGCIVHYFGNCPLPLPLA